MYVGVLMYFSCTPTQDLAMVPKLLQLAEHLDVMVLSGKQRKTARPMTQRPEDSNLHE